MSVDEPARPEHLVQVLELRLQMDRAGGGVDLIVDERELAIGQRRLVVHGVGGDFRRPARLTVADVVEPLSRHGEADENRLDLRDGDKTYVLRGLNDVSDIHHTLSGASFDWRAYSGVIDIELCAIDLRLVRLHRRLQLADGPLLLVVTLPGLGSGRKQRGVAVEIELRRFQLRL